MAFDYNEYNKNYKKENYDSILLRVPKGHRELIKKAAAAEGKSANEYIFDCIKEHEKRSELEANIIHSEPPAEYK